MMICVLLAGLGLTLTCACCVYADSMRPVAGVGYEHGAAAAFCQSKCLLTSGGHTAMAPTVNEVIFVAAGGVSLSLPGFSTVLPGQQLNGSRMASSRLFRPSRFS